MIRALWSLFPPNTFSQGLKLLADATSTPQDPGISWSKRAECGPNDDTDCVITIVRQLSKQIPSNNCVQLFSDHYLFGFGRMISTCGFLGHSFCGLFWPSTLTILLQMRLV